MNKQLLKGVKGKLIFLFALGSFLFSTNLSATHIVGGGLTYRCLGGDQYEITLNIYRDCFFGASNAPFDDPASIGIFDGATGFRLDEVRIPLGTQNDTLDVVIADTCLFVPATVCVHTTTYTQVVTLPERPTGYTLAYQRCCRNQTILNIVDPLETGATFISEISGQALAECNNQATYNNFPPLFICVNEPIDFDHSATDVDGDSLVYKICTPFDGASLENPQPQPPSSPPYDQVVYDPPFSLNNVLGGDPLTIDPNTGFITGVPNIIGQFVVGVCVEEYRNGVLISETRRDFQYNVGQCGIVEAIIGNSNTLCDDLTANFINNSTNSGTFHWDFGDPTTTNDVSTEFQPSYTYPDTGMYNVVLTVEIGNECEDVLNFPLYVKNTTAQPAFDLVTFECENGDIIVAVEDNSFDPDPRFEVTGWNWTLSDGQFSDEQHPVFVVSNDGQDITVTLEVESSDTCTESISQTVSPGDNNLGSLTSPSTICDGQSVELYPEFLTQNPNLTYSWSPGTNLNSTSIANPLANPTTTTTYTLTVNAPGTGCSALIEKLVNVGDFTDLGIDVVLTDSNGNQTSVDGGSGNVIVCDGQEVTLTVTNAASMITTVEWFDPLGQLISDNVSLIVNPDGSTTYTVNVVDENGCNGTSQITIQPSTVDISIQEIDNPGSGSGITDVDGDGTLDLCAGETSSLNVVNLNSSDQLTYQWIATPGVITAGANSANPTIFGLAEGIYTLVLNTTNQFGCSSQNEVLISVHDITDLEIQTTITDLGDNTTTTINGEDEIINCEGDNSTIILSETATSNNGNVTITWTDQNGNVIGTGPTVDISPFGDVTYTVTVTDQFGCSRSEEVKILGNPVDITITESTTGGGNGGELTDTDGDGDLDLCVGLSGSIDVGNNNAADVLTYQWTGSIITGGADTASPSISASTPGEHLLTLITTNQFGCTRMDVVDVDIFDPNASLDFTTEQDCAGTNIDFASGNTNFEFYIWDFGDGPGSTISGVQSPSYTFSEPGVYEVTQTPLPGLPCDLPTLTTTVEVAATLVDIDFEIEYIDCTPESVTIRFTDVTVTQVGSIIGREWIFGDGQTSTAINPVITVTQEGNFTAILNVLNSANCDGAATETFNIDFIDVSGLEEEIIACPLEGPVSLNSSPDDNLTYFWFPDTALDDPTSPNPTANPTGTTTYTVRITDNNGIDVCEIERMVTVIVPDEIGLDVDAEGSTSGEIVLDDNSNSNTIVSCEAETITLTTSTTTGTINDFDVVWTDSNGNVISTTGSISVMPGATETYTILVTDDFGCTESSMVTVEGGPVDISIDETFITGGDGNGIGGILNDEGFLELCTGESFDIAVNNLDPVDDLTYSWTGDNQIIVAGINTNTPTINSNTAGSFVLFLETENQFGCTQNDTIDINVIDSNADLSFEEIKDCNGVTVLFTNTSTGINDDYIWTFGDPGNPNASSADVDPSYTYPGVGSYVVTLGLNTQVTCVDDFVQEVDIVSPILASDFSFDYIDCSENGVTIQFTDLSINPQDNTNGYLWDFGNGMTSTEPNPILTFDEDEELNVSLTIFTEIDCESISQVQNIVISIIDDIQAPASILACENDGPQLIDLNANPNYVYQWSPATGLDDPTSPSPIADPGVSTTYTVTITDIFGSQPCSTVRTIEVFVPESIELTVPDDFETDCGDEATLTVDSPNADLEYEWTLDGDVLGNESTLELDGLSGPGVYVVTATDENGCKQTASVTVTGTQLDVDVDNIQFLCEDENGELNVIISNDPNDILEINWIGPNIISGGNTATPTISTEDAIETVYTVEIVNQFGCGTSEEVTVIVLDNDPVGDFINFGQCEGLTISFFNGSPNAPFYIWDFGDGSPTVNEPNPMHTYGAPGNYNVTLSLPNEADCADGDIASFTFPVTVEEDINFLADFDVTFDQCDNAGTITFTDMSSSSNQGTIVDWDWEFSTGDTSDEQNPTIMVGDNKVIAVTLTVTTDANCTTSIMREVPITLIDTQVQIEDQLSCIDLVAELNPNPNEDFTYTWEPAIGLSDPNSPNPTVTATSTTVYSVTITNEEQGCTSVQTMTFTVPEEIDLAVTDDINGCEQVLVNIEASSDVASTMYEWTLNGEVVSTDPNFEAESGRPNVYTVVATDEFGCQETETVTVANFEVLAALGANEQVLCLGNSTVLEVQLPQSGSDIFDYEWDNADLDLSDPSAPVANPSETTLYQVTISNQFGCSVTETVFVDVVDIDDGIGNALADPDTIFLGNSTQLAVNDIDGLNYDWTSGGTLDNDNISDPLATPTEDTEYTVTITDDNGCVTTRTVPVVVLNRACDEPFIFFPNAFSPNGDGENDVLRARAKDSFVDEVYWIVYNRWGERVFEANSLNEVWDGTYNGELVSPDAYGYYLRINCTDGDTFEKRGNVTVLR